MQQKKSKHGGAVLRDRNHKVERAIVGFGARLPDRTWTEKGAHGVLVGIGWVSSIAGGFLSH
jgi:hypothetical protein